LATHDQLRSWEPSDPAQVPSLRLPLETENSKTAKVTAADNTGARWTAAQAIGLQVAGNPELRYALARFLLELEVVTFATISIMTGFGGGKLLEIAASDPKSWFKCMDCDEVLLPHDFKAFRRLGREVRVCSTAQEGTPLVSDSLCPRCFGARLDHYAEERRVQGLARQARRAQLRRMPFKEYRLTPEWQAKRTQALSRAGYQCQVCGQRDARLDVHHNTYQRCGDESIYDLVALCAGCHALFHAGLQDAS
jgi:5-methylcytosine-specific restriction endonuclease McrA